MAKARSAFEILFWQIHEKATLAPTIAQPVAQPSFGAVYFSLIGLRSGLSEQLFGCFCFLPLVAGSRST
jgi:hypothetical protein